jgi:hypothetical protein
MVRCGGEISSVSREPGVEEKQLRSIVRSGIPTEGLESLGQESMMSILF